jgi:ribosomal protein L37AE/L43A
MKLFSREDYKEIQKQYKDKSYCPFCDKENRREHIIWEGKYWYLLHNFAPYS